MSKTAGETVKVVILSTDTKHHRYFANRISALAQTFAMVETQGLDHRKLYFKQVKRRKTPWALIDNPFLRLPGSNFNKRQDEFEEHFWDDGTPSEFHGLEALHTFPTVNDAACVNRVKEIEPDLIVSFGTGRIKRQLLDLGGFKINVHRGILPKYRGLDSDMWAFYFRDFEQVGTTVHVLAPQFDTGSIVGQERLVIDGDMLPHQIRFHTTLAAVHIIERAIEDLRSGKEPLVTQQDLSMGRHYSYIPPLKRMLAIGRFNQYTQRLNGRQ